MERSEKIGLGLAIAGHVVLFGLLSVGFLATPNPIKLQQQPVEVSLVKDVGLEATAPQAQTPPAQSVAPEQGEPEEAAPPAPSVAAPAPKPEPIPQPAPKPEPKPKPAKPAPKPAPAPKPEPKPEPKPRKKEPPAEERKAEKPAPAKHRVADSKAEKTPPAKAQGIGKSAESKASRPRGSRLGPDFLKGLTSDESKSTSQVPRAAKIDAAALASIVQAIARQIQPCADRQVDPGPGANEIVTTLNLRLNEDGTLAATPTVVRQTGVNDDNRRYARRVIDLGIAAFKGCAPLKLPPQFYSTPNGGWNNINYQWKLR
ncbi:cell envelope integrity protein TolA [Sphingomonas lycopersici]|uniref:Cell envelope integrity protein TolA n=1 Tax=Sphingomonas lycopersici TaxID=2951807 RepID=A0AA42CVW4_9SPHN|nr:cell envelope integrity protein TolA [Sphingomonas lycopersici]